MQPTNVVAASVSTFQVFTLTAGASGGEVGFNTGNVGGPHGSLSPGNTYNPTGASYTISAIETNNGNLTFRLVPINIPNTDLTFSQIEITGTFTQGASKQTILRSQVSNYNPVSGITTLWSFTAIPSIDMIDGNVYEIILRWVP